MKRQEIPYRMPDGSTNWLQPGSQAHQLHTEGKTKQLAEHMKDVQRRHDMLELPTVWDKLKGGFKHGELVIIASSGVGKSRFQVEPPVQYLEIPRG